MLHGILLQNAFGSFSRFSSQYFFAVPHILDLVSIGFISIYKKPQILAKMKLQVRPIAKNENAMNF